MSANEPPSPATRIILKMSNFVRALLSAGHCALWLLGAGYGPGLLPGPALDNVDTHRICLVCTDLSGYSSADCASHPNEPVCICNKKGINLSIWTAALFVYWGLCRHDNKFTSLFCHQDKTRRSRNPIALWLALHDV